MELRPGLDPKTGDMDMDITHATEIPREHEEEPKPEFPICETCLNLQVSAGDRVPYGSTTAQLPDEWDCKAAWTEPDADEQIEKHADFDEHRLIEEQPEDVDPVFEHQISRDLRDRFPPCREHEESCEKRSKRCRHEEAAPMRLGQRQLIGE